MGGTGTDPVRRKPDIMSFLSGNILWNLLWIVPLVLAAAVAGGVRRGSLLRRMFGTDERAA